MKIDILDVRKLDLNLSVVFLALWEERSVTRAAARLALSQAATSAALARLRETCGDPLFVRGAIGMEPTPRASAMAESLEAGVEHMWRVLTESAAFDSAASTRSFSIGMSDDFELAIGPSLSRRIREASAGVSLIFRQTNRHTVEQMLKDREIEIAVVAGAIRRAWIAKESIGDAGYACLLDERATGAALPLSLQEYLALPHVLISYSGRIGTVDHALRALGRERQLLTALTHFSAAPAFLTGTRAIATIPTHAATALARISPLTVCAAPLELGRYPVQIVWRRDAQGDAALEWLRLQLRTAAVAAMTEENPIEPKRRRRTT